jgi:uncharacterized protein
MTIKGHAVRALYLTTAAANMDDEFVDDARRLMKDVINNRMYVTGNVGSIIKVF